MKRYIKLIISICLIAYPVIAFFLSLPTGEDDFSQQSFGVKQIFYVAILIVGIWLLITSLKKIINSNRE
jgi:hypothetical protein